jgi:hypothetical protein
MLPTTGNVIGIKRTNKTNQNPNFNILTRQQINQKTFLFRGCVCVCVCVWNPIRLNIERHFEKLILITNNQLLLWFIVFFDDWKKWKTEKTKHPPFKSRKFILVKLYSWSMKDRSHRINWIFLKKKYFSKFWFSQKKCF